jgi:hypothetical protein
MAERRRRSGTGRKSLTAEERAQWARERQVLIGKVLLQEDWEGSIVMEHIRGSQYLVKLANGQEVYASHKKQKNETGDAAFTRSGWRLWEDRR